MYCIPKCVIKREQRLVDLKIEQSGKPTSEKMTYHGSVSDLPADIVSVDRVLIRLYLTMPFFLPDPQKLLKGFLCSFLLFSCHLLVTFKKSYINLSVRVTIGAKNDLLR